MSKQSEDDLLADEIEDEGEEDQINKDSLPDERNAVPAHASRQLQDKTAASSEEISQLTHAILGLTKRPARTHQFAAGRDKRQRETAGEQISKRCSRQKSKKQRWRGEKLHERLRPVN